MIRHIVAIQLALLAAATPPLAAAQEASSPRSAIPWLSRVLQDVPPPEQPLARPDTADARESGSIAVTPLDDVVLDSVGLLPPEETGFSRALWRSASAARVRDLILRHPDSGVPEARALFRRLLLAEANPPASSGDVDQVLLARIDRLLEAGALNEAEALMQRAGAETPELFRRMFDVALLLEDAEPACEALRRNPALSPTLPARIFCLARDGDWNAAEITLTLGRNVGELSTREERALARFLDPELFEHLPPPPPPDPLTPLDFLLREAVGLPRPQGALPIAFAHRDLADYLPMRTRIMAGERLALEAAIAPTVLFAAYRAGQPAASGGVWERAAAVQALDAALADGSQKAGEALLAADAALTERGLRVPFARAYADALSDLDPATLGEEARRVQFELLLLAGNHEAAAEVAGPEPDQRENLLLELAGVRQHAEDTPEALEPRAVAARDGLRDRQPADERAERLDAMLEEGRQGEMLLAALAYLADGAAVDPASLRAALYALRKAGQEASARQIAIETLLATGSDS